jgi:hypothetical protein
MSNFCLVLRSNCSLGSLSGRWLPSLKWVGLILALATAGLPLMADTTSAQQASSHGDFGQYLADHQSDLAPFFEKNGDDIVRLAVPAVMGMMGWVVVITMVIGWGLDFLLSRGFAYFFAPAFAEWKRSVMYATGQLALSFVYTCLLGIAIVFSLRFAYGGVIGTVAVTLLLVVALAAQIVWILYLYRTNFAVAAVFYLALVVVHTIVGLIVAQSVIGLQASSVATDFVDHAITPRLQAEADSTKRDLAAADSARDATKAQVDDLQNQISQSAMEADQIRAEIAAKKDSDFYVFSQIVRVRAQGDLASARDQLTAFLAKYPSSTVNDLARAQLDQLNSQMVVVETQKKQEDAAAAAAAAQARADLLARAAKGDVTLSDVSNLLGLPTDTASDSWGYRQQMIFNPLTNEKHGLEVYFSEGIVQGVDYNKNVGTVETQ